MTAIKTDEIGNTRVRVSAWMNAQHKSGLISCLLKGTIKPLARMQPHQFQKQIDLLPGEFVPLHLGNYGRDFDPFLDTKTTARTGGMFQPQCVPMTNN